MYASVLTSVVARENRVQTHQNLTGISHPLRSWHWLILSPYSRISQTGQSDTLVACWPSTVIQRRGGQDNVVRREKLFYVHGTVQRNSMSINVQQGATHHSLVFSLEGRAWQEPEPSHVTGMALAHCILGKFLGVVCHCFPPPLDIFNKFRF